MNLQWIETRKEELTKAFFHKQRDFSGLCAKEKISIALLLAAEAQIEALKNK